ncbi:response regulator [Endothiovibrio diazotrophicus]
MRGWDIRRRLLMLTLLPAALIALVLSLYFTHARVEDLNRTLNSRGARMAATLSLASEHALVAGHLPLLHPMLRNLVASHDVGAVTLYGADGGVLIEARDRAAPRRPGPLERFSAWYSGLPEVLVFREPILRLEETALSSGEGARGDAPKVGWVEVELTSGSTLARQAKVVSTGLLIAFLGLVLAAVGAVRAGRDVSRLIVALNEVVRRLGGGELSARVGEGGGAAQELAALGQGINSMADALEHSRDAMQRHIEEATRELRETLEAVEVQNVELDLARRRAVEASRVKSEFLSSMSHEIRTPMNGVIGFSNLLLHTPLSEVQQEYARTISDSASHLLRIINDILDFSKAESGQLTLESLPFDLQEVVDEALAMLAPLAYEKGLELVALIYSDVPTRLVGDPMRIRQVITNLVGNAIKFTAEGSVVVRTMLESEEPEQVLLRITVSDTGIGIPTDRRRVLFDAFSQVDASVTRRFGGTGLGLAISKRLVQQMFGDIGVDSREGVGSTFWFTLRCERQVGEREEEAPQRGGEVLLFDAHLLARVAQRHRIGSWGYPVIEVEGLDMVAGRLCGERREVVVCGLSGGAREAAEIGEWIAHWRRINPQVRTLLLVNSVDQALYARLEADGADRVLPKISRHGTLARELERLMEADGEPAPATDREVEPAKEERFDGLRVLVVDDNAINLMLTATLLRDKGVEVVQAEGGEEAVERASRSHFDLILMDIHMPRVSGVEAVRRIRAREPEGARTPIIALTAHALPGERERFLDAGMDDCLVKPLDVAVLWRAVRQWTSGGPRAETAPAEGHGEAGGGAVYDPVMAMKLAGGRRPLAERLIEMLLSDLDVRRERIDEAFRRGDHADLLERVHKLHGSAAHCGTPALRHAAGVLEAQLSAGGEASVEALVAALDHEIERLLVWDETRSRASLSDPAMIAESPIS